MMITANNGFIEQSERYAFDNAGESLKKYILLQKGELAYNHGASKLRPFGSCFALTTAESALSLIHISLIARNCSEHYKCACCIAEYVRNTWHKELSDEELVFLTIHLKRIRMGK